MLTLSRVQFRGEEAARAFTNKNRLSIEFLQALYVQTQISSHVPRPVQVNNTLREVFSKIIAEARSESGLLPEA